MVFTDSPQSFAASARYNRFFQQLLTYRRTALDLQRFRLDGTSSVETARARWAFKAQLQFFWSQAARFHRARLNLCCGVGGCGGYGGGSGGYRGGMFLVRILWDDLFVK